MAKATSLNSCTLTAMRCWCRGDGRARALTSGTEPCLVCQLVQRATAPQGNEDRFCTLTRWRPLRLASALASLHSIYLSYTCFSFLSQCSESCHTSKHLAGRPGVCKVTLGPAAFVTGCQCCVAATARAVCDPAAGCKLTFSPSSAFCLSSSPSVGVVSSLSGCRFKRVSVQMLQPVIQMNLATQQAHHDSSKVHCFQPTRQ